MSSPLSQAINQLNPRQREAVEITDGPLLVVAGAGSGKTRALTVRIANLVENRGVDPRAILAVTFTNKAAAQMRERVADLIPESARNITLSTFHSFCCLLMRRWSARAGFDKGFTIYDDDDQERLMKQILDGMSLDKKKFPPRYLLSLISQAKNELQTPAEFFPEHDHADEFREVYARYQKALMANAAVDFDDLIFSCYYLLARNPDLLAKVQNQYKYFLVDEYQDTNNAQYRLIALLSKGSGNLCVVGDEDQSIYGWRGATIRNILEFESDFPGARVVILDQNYRSTQLILDAASEVIANNSGKRKKHLWTDKKGGEPLVFKQVNDDREEAEFMAAEIERLNGQGTALAEMAVLFRMNSLTRTLEQALVKRRIPYEVTGGVRFFNRREVKDILAYLRVLANDRDSISLRRCINTPRRGIGEATVARLEEEGPLWDRVNDTADKNPKSKIGKFRDMMRLFKEETTADSLYHLTHRIISEIDYLAYLKESDPESSQERLGNIDSLLADMRMQEESTPDLTLQQYLEQVSLHSAVDDMDDAADKVHLLTMHNAKGLEFPVVFIAAMEEGIFPHRSSSDLPEELEEERRLAYVGITRAMKRLYLLAARRRFMFGTWNFQVVSRFIAEIPRTLFSGGIGKTLSASGTGEGEARPLSFRTSGVFGLNAGPAARSVPTADVHQGVPGTMLNLKPGTMVYHQTFGLGRVLSTEGKELANFRMSVEFKNSGKKNFLLQYTNLRVINTQNH